MYLYIRCNNDPLPSEVFIENFINYTIYISILIFIILFAYLMKILFIEDDPIAGFSIY